MRKEEVNSEQYLHLHGTRIFNVVYKAGVAEAKSCAVHVFMLSDTVNTIDFFDR